MNKYIITGATSFIGNALIDQLSKDEECEIVAIIRPGSIRSKSICITKQVKVIESNLSNLDSLKNSILYGANVIFHIGWSSDFVNARYNIEGQMINVSYLNKVMLLACHIGCDKVIGIGSQAECGRVNEPISDKTKDNPETAYAIAKCRAYEQGMESALKYHISFYWPRLLSAYGPNDKSKTLVMSCLNAVARREKIALTPCEQTWDFIYVEDVARALILIAKKGKAGKKYSIASGIGRELKDYIMEMADITKCSLLLDGIGKREYSNEQVMYLLGDIKSLWEDTGFTICTSFGDGIVKTIQNNEKYENNRFF